MLFVLNLFFLNLFDDIHFIFNPLHQNTTLDFPGQAVKWFPSSCCMSSFFGISLHSSGNISCRVFKSYLHAAVMSLPSLLVPQCVSFVIIAFWSFLCRLFSTVLYLLHLYRSLFDDYFLTFFNRFPRSVFSFYQSVYWHSYIQHWYWYIFSNILSMNLFLKLYTGTFPNIL